LDVYIKKSLPGAGVFTYAGTCRIMGLAPAGVYLADLLERRDAMIIIPLSLYELISISLTAFVAYIIYLEYKKKK